MKLLLEVKLWEKPFSANQMHYMKYKRDTVKYKRFKKSILNNIGGDYGIKDKDLLKLTLVAGFSSKLSDLDNAFKPLLDAMQHSMGFDDRQIFEIEALKDHTAKGEEYIMIRLETITEYRWKKRIAKLFKSFVGVDKDDK